uniref:Uncharacterized protein n=1 Tax=Caenorhabditis japonica TaxID=281687 RepID=A0A8R1IBM2_CAEJA
MLKQSSARVRNGFGTSLAVIGEKIGFGHTKQEAKQKFYQAASNQDHKITSQESTRLSHGCIITSCCLSWRHFGTDLADYETDEEKERTTKNEEVEVEVEEEDEEGCWIIKRDTRKTKERKRKRQKE